MKGDFTRDTFDHLRHFSRVLMQQGRVQLDADFNEQVAILLHYLRTAVRDIIGPYGAIEDGFKITVADGKVKIGPGRYYVDGILCENDAELAFDGQEGVTESEGELTDGHTYFIYLDVWERHVTWIQDDRIHEVALGQADTSTRTKVVWRVRIEEPPANQKLDEWVKGRVQLSSGTMRACVGRVKDQENLCSIPPESRYRGLENQLYRIEIHRGGVAWDGQTDDDGMPLGNVAAAATFKWSRDNGSIVFPIVRQQGNIVTVQSLGRDERTSLSIGDWVEIVDDDQELQGIPGTMAQVDKVDLVEMTVTLRPPDDVPSSGLSWPGYDEESANHPLLRRWDHRAIEGVTLYQGAILATESSGPDNGWVEIENGMEVQFQPPIGPVLPTQYRTGDYWLIPARVATGKVEWPPKLDNEGQIVKDAHGNEIPEAMPPHGIEHHYAPLAVVMPNQEKPKDCRGTFLPLLSIEL